MENCGNCHRGLVQGEVCGECKGTMLLQPKAKAKKETIVEKVKKVLKKK